MPETAELKWLSDYPCGQNQSPPNEICEIIEFPVQPQFLNPSFLHQKYVVEGLSASQISKEIFSARSTVVKHLKNFGIPLRSEEEARKLRKGQLGYGERTKKGKPDKHKRELENIRIMQKLRGQGYSYWKIAEVFNTMKIPTKTRKAKWHPTTVMKILKKITNEK